MNTNKFLNLFPVMDEESKEMAKKVGSPFCINGKEPPKSLDGITLGELIELQGAETDRELILKSCKILLGMSDEETLKCYWRNTVGMANFVVSELKRISELFDACRVEPTADELKAGVESLNFGIFGLLDWYAQRQGIADLDDVAKIGWVRIYMAMKKDAELQRYNRRLNDVMAKK